MAASNSTDKLRIMCIGAHPADIFDQSGGTMAHHIERGDEVACVVLTHGARVHDEVLATDMFRRESIPDADELNEMMAERAEVRTNESRRACNLLGIQELFFFGEEDGVILPDLNQVKRLASLFRQWKPDVIITHFPFEDGGLWSTHASTGHIVMMARWAAAVVEPGDARPPHQVAMTFFWGQASARSIWDTRLNVYNDVIVDISDVIERKLEALECLESQGYPQTLYTRKRVETSDGHLGMRGGVAYGEAFISECAQSHTHLPVSKLMLELSRLADREQLDRMSKKINTFEMPMPWMAST